MTPTERRAPALDVAIGLMVKRARQARGIDVADLAARVLVQQAVIYRIEGGILDKRRKHVLGFVLLCRLADALGMPVSTLVKMAEDMIYETPACAGPVVLVELP